MKAAGKTFDPVTYDGAGHGFMRAGEAPDASPENKKAREEALAKMLKLMKSNNDLQPSVPLPHETPSPRHLPYRATMNPQPRSHRCKLSG